MDDYTLDDYTQGYSAGYADCRRDSRHQLDKARAEVERLRAALLDAAEEIEHWGSYAGDYFAKKWDLAGAIRQARKAAECHG